MTYHHNIMTYHRIITYHHIIMNQHHNVMNYHHNIIKCHHQVNHIKHLQYSIVKYNVQRKTMDTIFSTNTSYKRSLGMNRNHSVYIFVYLSVQICVRPIISVCIDILTHLGQIYKVLNITSGATVSVFDL